MLLIEYNDEKKKYGAAICEKYLLKANFSKNS